MFSNEVTSSDRSAEYIEVICGCTTHPYGDAVGDILGFLLEVILRYHQACQGSQERSSRSTYGTLTVNLTFNLTSPMSLIVVSCYDLFIIST